MTLGVEGTEHQIFLRKKFFKEIKKNAVRHYSKGLFLKSNCVRWGESTEMHNSADMERICSS